MENGVGLQLCVKYEEDDEPEEEEDDKEDEKLETPPTAPPLPLPNIIAICIFLAGKKMRDIFCYPRFKSILGFFPFKILITNHSFLALESHLKVEGIR